MIIMFAGNYDGRRKRVITTYSLDTLDEALVRMVHDRAKYDFVEISLVESGTAFTIDKYHHISYTPDVYGGVERRQASDGVDRRRTESRDLRQAFMSYQVQAESEDFCQLFRERRGQAGQWH